MQSQAKDGLTVAERLTLPFLKVYCLPPYSREPHSMAKLAMHCSKTVFLKLEHRIMDTANL